MVFASTICPESLLAGLHLYFRRSIPEESETDISESRLDDGALPGIRCPICKWRPLRSSRWMCADSGPPEYFYDACGERFQKDRLLQRLTIDLSAAHVSCDAA